MTLSQTIELFEKILKEYGDGEINPSAYEGFDFSFVKRQDDGYLKPTEMVTIYFDGRAVIEKLNSNCGPTGKKMEIKI